MTKEDKDLQQTGENLFHSAVYANSVEMLKQNFSSYAQQIILYTKLRKLKYDSLVKEGFKEEQAMEIITKIRLFE